jgi:hypothetical protein
MLTVAVRVARNPLRLAFRHFDRMQLDERAD